MRILLDTCIDLRALAALQAEGHDVDHVQCWNGDSGDDLILARLQPKPES